VRRFVGVVVGESFGPAAVVVVEGVLVYCVFFSFLRSFLASFASLSFCCSSGVRAGVVLATVVACFSVPFFATSSGVVEFSGGILLFSG